MTDAELIQGMSQAKALLCRMNTPEDAEDAVQDAALAMLKTKAPFDGRSKFASWFCRVAINARLQKMRGKLAVAMKDSVPLTPSMYITTATPESECRRAELLAMVSRAAEDLAPQQRQAYLAYYVLGLKANDAANLLGIKPATFKSTLYRARHAIALKCSSRPH